MKSIRLFLSLNLLRRKSKRFFCLFLNSLMAVNRCFVILVDTGVSLTVYPVHKKGHAMLCAIWYHLYNLKTLKITQGGGLLLVKLQTLA